MNFSMRLNQTCVTRSNTCRTLEHLSRFCTFENLSRVQTLVTRSFMYHVFIHVTHPKYLSRVRTFVTRSNICHVFEHLSLVRTFCRAFEHLWRFHTRLIFRRVTHPNMSRLSRMRTPRTPSYVSYFGTRHAFKYVSRAGMRVRKSRKTGKCCRGVRGGFLPPCAQGGAGVLPQKFRKFGCQKRDFHPSPPI